MEIQGDMYSRQLQYDRIATLLGASLGQGAAQMNTAAMMGQMQSQQQQQMMQMFMMSQGGGMGNFFEELAGLSLPHG